MVADFSNMLPYKQVSAKQLKVDLAIEDLTAYTHVSVPRDALLFAEKLTGTPQIRIAAQAGQTYDGVVIQDKVLELVNQNEYALDSFDLLNAEGVRDIVIGTDHFYLSEGLIGSLPGTGGNTVSKWTKDPALKIWEVGGVPVGSGANDWWYPQGLFLDETGGELYVADSENNRVKVLDISDGSLVRTIGVGLFTSTGLSSLTIIGVELFVVGRNAAYPAIDYCTVFNKSTGAKLREFNLTQHNIPYESWYYDVTTEGTELFILNQRPGASNTVLVLDPTTGAKNRDLSPSGIMNVSFSIESIDDELHIVGLADTEVAVLNKTTGDIIRQYGLSEFAAVSGHLPGIIALDPVSGNKWVALRKATGEAKIMPFDLLGSLNAIVLDAAWADSEGNLDISVEGGTAKMTFVSVSNSH